MRDAVFVTLGQEWRGTDDIFGMIVLDFLQRSKLPVPCGFFRNDVTGLYIDCFTRFAADEIHFARIKDSHVYFISQVKELLIDSIVISITFSM